MTRVRVRREGRRLGLEAWGHAEGSPSVCGAVSMLLQTLAAWAGECGELADARFASGEGSVWVTEALSREFGMVCHGLRLLGRDYGQFVEVMDGDAA